MVLKEEETWRDQGDGPDGEEVVQPPLRTVELRFDQYRGPLLTDVTS